MSFEQNMILDATTGSIARFVNHSCDPNCRMRKWTVNGQPRIALFAGDRPISTGEELTYDYKFSPFGKDITKCLCGSSNCRGVLGPRQKEAKEPAKEVKKRTQTGPGRAKPSPPAKKQKPLLAGKRKLKELLDGRADDIYDVPRDVKRRKLLPPKTKKTVKRSLSSSSVKLAARGAATVIRKSTATVIKKSVSSLSVSAKAALGGGRPKTPAKSAFRRSTGSASVLEKLAKTGHGAPASASASRSSSLTIVAAGAAPDEDRAPARPPKGWPASTAGPDAAKPSPLATHAAMAVKRSSTDSPAATSPRPALEIERPKAQILVVPSSPNLGE